MVLHMLPPNHLLRHPRDIHVVQKALPHPRVDQYLQPQGLWFSFQLVQVFLRSHQYSQVQGLQPILQLMQIFPRPNHNPKSSELQSSPQLFPIFLRPHHNFKNHHNIYLSLRYHIFSPNLAHHHLHQEWQEYPSPQHHNKRRPQLLHHHPCQYLQCQMVEMHMGHIDYQEEGHYASNGVIKITLAT